MPRTEESEHDESLSLHPGLTAGISLQGRVAVVTGAGGGIGRGTALMLVHAGAAVVCSDLESPALSRTAEMIEQAGGTSDVQVADVSSKSEMDALAAGAADRHGRLDVWVNAAGILLRSMMIDLTEDSLRRTMAVNFEGTLWGSIAAARAMIPGGGGSIVNISSAGADFPGYGQVAYSASKAAVVQLTKTLAVEFGPKGIRANVVAPGWVETPMTAYHFTGEDGVVDEEKRRSTLEEFSRNSPLRITGQPEDIAWSILFLASDSSRFMTGQVLRPNGGIVMP